MHIAYAVNKCNRRETPMERIHNDIFPLGGLLDAQTLTLSLSLSLSTSSLLCISQASSALYLSSERDSQMLINMLCGNVLATS